MGVLSKRKRNRGNAEIPMASTSDVAFLLLVFFIVMPMKSEEIGIAMVLPGKSKQDTTVKVKQSNVATIRILSSNAMTLDHQPVDPGFIHTVIAARDYPTFHA